VLQRAKVRSFEPFEILCLIGYKRNLYYLNLPNLLDIYIYVYIYIQLYIYIYDKPYEWQCVFNQLVYNEMGHSRAGETIYQVYNIERWDTGIFAWLTWRWGTVLGFE
jgi:hypothetical protein